MIYSVYIESLAYKKTCELYQYIQYHKEILKESSENTAHFEDNCCNSVSYIELAFKILYFLSNLKSSELAILSCLKFHNFSHQIENNWCL